MAKKLLVKTPKTRNGVTLVYDENKQVVYKEALMELGAKSNLEDLNARLPEHLRHIIKVVEVQDVTEQTDNISKLKTRLKELQLKKEEEELMKKIAELEGNVDVISDDKTKVRTVKLIVADIATATTVDQVKELAGTDDRVGVTEAAAKKIAELEAKA